MTDFNVLVPSTNMMAMDWDSVRRIVMDGEQFETVYGVLVAGHFFPSKNWTRGELNDWKDVGKFRIPDAGGVV